MLWSGNFILRHFNFAVELKQKTVFLKVLISRIYRSQPQNREILLRAAEPVVIFSRCSHALSLLEKNLKKVDFSNEGFLHKKITNKDVYVDYGSKEDIPESACSLRH